MTLSYPPTDVARLDRVTLCYPPTDVARLGRVTLSYLPTDVATLGRMTELSTDAATEATLAILKR